MTIGTIRELGAEKKTVLLRLDLNSPIDPASSLILDDKRFRDAGTQIQTGAARGSV